MRRIIAALAILLFCALAFAQNRWINRDFKYTHSGMQDIGYPCPGNNPACYHSGWNFELAVGNYIDDYTNTYTMTYNAGGGAATLVDDGTWPHTTGIIGGAQGSAWSFDGNAYLDRADDNSFDMDPTSNPGDGGGRIAGDFSIQCIVTPSDISANAEIISKWTPAGNQRAWSLDRNTTAYRFFTSVDGTVVTSVQTAGSAAAYRPAFITVTYDQSATTGTIYVDNQATGTNVAMSASIHNSTGTFAIGSRPGGVSPWEGLIHNCAIYKGHVITEAQHDAMFAQWQGRASTFARDVVTTTTSASPPAIPQAPAASGTEPFLIDNPANSFYIGSPVANSGGLYGASDLTSKWWRGSAETCAAGHPTGWTITENGGGGAGTLVIDCDTTTSAHGGTSILFTSNGGGAPKNAKADGACQTNWIGQDMSLIAWGRSTTGAASCALNLVEYSNANCTGFLAETVLYGPANPGSDWTQVSGTHAAAAWNGGTNSWFPRIVCYDTGTAYTASWDAAMALQAPSTFHTSASCTTDSDADAVCTDTIHSILSPISANGQMSIIGTFRSPWAGTDRAANTCFFTDGNYFAANTYSIRIQAVTDEPQFLTFDNAAAQRAVGPNVLNWAADTDYQVVARTGGNDNLGIYWNAAWDNTVIGAGTGVRNAAQATSYISGSHNTPADIWTRNLQFFRRMLEVIP
jgi:hypothetical protein